jgi:glycosyltransferase involved in cell wall biosynthesis
VPNNNEPWIIIVLCALDIGRKAQDVLIKALSNPAWESRNWQLHLYGEGNDKAMLESLIKELHLENKIFLKGHSNNVKSALLTSHLLVQATHLDGMPISVTEAMAMARPCLVSTVGDMPDWITDGYNGFITEKVNPDALHTVMEKAWNKRNEWKQMGILAQDTFIKKYPQPYEEQFAKLLKKYFR